MPKKKNWKKSIAQKAGLIAKSSENNTKLREQKYTQKKVDVSAKHVEANQKQSGSLENIQGQCIQQGKYAVLGNFHQGAARFLHNSGKQCVANSLTSIMYSRIKDVDQWCASDLDKILLTGNELYGFLQASSTMNDQYLLISELPEALELFNTDFKFNIGESLVGVINNVSRTNEAVSENIVVTLYNALNTVLSDSYGCFVTFGGNTFAIIQRNSLYYIFDSHSRNEKGLQVSDGRSVVVQVCSIEEVYHQCTDLAKSMNIHHAQFEVTPIEIHDGSTHSTKEHEKSKYVPSYDNNNEDILISDTMFPNTYTFCPLTSEIKHSLCILLKIRHISTEATTHRPSNNLEQPTKTKPILADGNCFFRSLSYVISGSENHHKKVRTAITNHLVQNEKRFAPYLRPEYTSINEYNQTSQMQDLGTWATEIEILAAADLLQTDIYTFSDTWLRFSCEQLYKDKSCREEAIYLKHCNQSHYEVVLNVENKVYEMNFSKPSRKTFNLETQPVNMKHVTDGHCKNQMRKRKHNVSSDVTEKEPSKKSKMNNQPEIKSKQNKQIITSLTKNLQCNRLTKAPENKKSHRKLAQRLRYNTDLKFRERKKQAARDRYRFNKGYRETTKSRSKENGNQKYKTDDKHKNKLKAQSIQKYKTDDEHKNKLKAQSIQKYKTDDEHKNKLKAQSIQKYKANPEHQENLKQRNIIRRAEQNKQKQNTHHIITSFKEEITTGPEYVCCVCHRLLFKYQVVHCKEATYHGKGREISKIAAKCITYAYLHTCNEACSYECESPESAKSLWICYTCHRKVLSGKMPAESVTNNLEVQPMPERLKCLNTLEQHLIALHIPFIKMMALPKGGQHGVHGPMMCVPSNLNNTTELLPRFETDDQTIRVKLKRKLCYKGHYLYQFVSKIHLQEALEYLKQNNKWYASVEFNSEWENTLSEDNNTESSNSISGDGDDLPDNGGNRDTPCDKSGENHNNESVVDEENDEAEERLKGMLLDTCLQPVDIGQELLDQHFDDIVCIAPAQGNSPVSILLNEGNEAKCFPALYPDGSRTFTDERDERITLGRYLHCRLMNADNRFASNTDYIFYAQYLSELNQVISNVSIALRKGQGIGKHVSSAMLTEKKLLGNLLKSDEGYKFLKPIRGTPPFWQSAQKDLFAMIRQLGIPTWFCSFSSADLRWSELVGTILKQQGDTRKASDLDWTEKCEILRSNPVTAARMFDHRFHYFLKNVIMSQAAPIGKIKDYFYRVEFQQRGSPHTHCLFWVEDAPKVDKDDDETVTAFVDQYITCKLPDRDEDEELHEIVTNVQTHSSRHSKSCRKKGTTCRFNFPRPPSKQTFICRPILNDGVGRPEEETNHDGCDKDNLDEQKEENDSSKHLADESKNQSSNNNNETTNTNMTIAEAKLVLENLWNAISDTTQSYESVDELFSTIGLSQELFQQVYQKITKKSNIILERAPCDIWINQYNEDLLRCWNANMDIQFVFDAYSCVVYIVSYISKAEREMGLLLDHAQREAQQDGNTDAKAAMKKLGSIYLHNREISAQEAVYRVCNLRLKEGSRKVQYIPVGNDPIKLSLPLKVLQSKSKGNDLEEDEIWMTNFVDRYKARPKEREFEDMCLATFCSEYRVLSKSEVTNRTNKSSTIHELDNGLGFVKKRSRTDAAVIRYPRFSATRTPEKYYRGILQLFLPYHFDSHLKPPRFERYEDFYNVGAVSICGEMQLVKDIVGKNRSLFEKEAESIDRAQETLDTYGPLEDAWAQICPETEAERLNCLQTKVEITGECEDDDIPDLKRSDTQEGKMELHTTLIPRSVAEPLLRSLNNDQAEIFYKVRQWCLDRVLGKNPEPFHIFASGGAGTGKSHLIKAIYYETTRILARILPNPDDISVLMTAPTGVAAFNISACTIHSAFSIRIDSKMPYQPLGEDKLNSLRSKLGSLEILIIDKISMVDHKLFCYIHGRLRQIKQTRDFSPFGKVSVLAVGDFYQLPPVKGKPLYVDSGTVNLWHDLFCIVELTEIIRQKGDLKFAQMLNRLRTKKKSEALDQEDLTILRNCETGEQSDSMYIFATNAQVDERNIESLHAKCINPICIEAQDFSRHPKTAKLEKQELSHVRVFNTNLSKSITLAEGARVMLIKNIDVSDGLVNGVFGTVVGITLTPGKTFPSTIYICFDDTNVGLKLRKQSPTLSLYPEGSTLIEPHEDVVNNSGGVRRQFALKLAWACTVHKVQGLTVEKAVVSFARIFAPGQAYVALSRVTSINGLIVQDFNENAIFCNEKIEHVLQNMPRLLKPMNMIDQAETVIMMHNVQGLVPHYEDLKNDKRFLKAHFICLTETWLTECGQCANFELENFRFYNNTRSMCYDQSNQLFMGLQQQAHGGVGFYRNINRNCEMLSLNVTNLEHIAFIVPDMDLSVVVIYRPQSYKADLFLAQMQILLGKVGGFTTASIVMGDFNQDVLLGGSSIQQLINDNAYKQMVENITTESGTLIDHVYCKGLDNIKAVTVIPTYYSYHEVICIELG